MTEKPRLRPVAEGDRIDSIDVLRGVAVLGILILNIQSFAMIGAAYMNPTVYGDLTGPNYVVWYLSQLLCDQKFMAIFSMLFGAGVALMTSRAEAAGRGSAGVHYRRMGWLILFGLLHAYLLWYGDILYTYGMCGLVLWPLRKIPPWLLIGLGVIAIGIASMINVGFGLMLQGTPQMAANLNEVWTPSQQIVEEELAAYRGGWLDQMSDRAPMALMFQTFLFVLGGIGLKAGGMMLIGMALFKLGVFSAVRSVGFYVTMIVVCLGLGLPTVAWGLHQHEAHDWDLMYSFYFGSQYNFWASVVVSIGYSCAVVLVCKLKLLTALTRPLAAVGRMAFTNYFMQTVICTTIFYGHGFGFFGSVERIGQIGVVLAVWALQLIVSPIWLHVFRFGPLEWLWRSLTYWKLQPMRLDKMT